MKFENYKKDNYTALTPIGPERKPSQIEALLYVGRLALTTGTDISDWDIRKVFGTGNGPELIEDKTHINEKFFAKKEGWEAKNPTGEIKVPDLVGHKMHEVKATKTKRAIEDIKRDIAQKERNARDYYASFENFLDEIFEGNERITYLSANPEKSKLPEQVTKLLAGGFWEFWNYGEYGLDLVTKNDIICSQQVPKAGMNIHLNMGKFLARYHMGRFWCFPHHGNLGSPRKSHPHIHEDGRVCWGTAKDAAIQALGTEDIVTVYTMLQNILVNHNIDDPGYSIQSFMYDKVWNPSKPARPYAYWEEPKVVAAPFTTETTVGGDFDRPEVATEF